MADKKERRKYSLDFKQDAVQLSNKIGVSEAGGKLDIPLSARRRGRQMKNIRPAEKSQDVLRLQLEIKKLKKDLAEKEAIISMLQKAPAFFAREREKESKKQQSKRKKDQKPGFWEWLIHGTGSVSEPWPTAEEVLQDPAVQEEIQKVREAFNKHQIKNGRKVKSESP